MDSITATEPPATPAPPPTPLDRDVRRETAFRTWAELVAAIATGYVPTVYADREAQRRLRAALKAAGLPVWPSDQVAEEVRRMRRRRPRK